VAAVVSEPRSIRPVEAAPVDEVVTRLEDMLRLARAGELRAVTVVGLLTGGEIVTFATASDDIFRMAGALAYMQHRLYMGHVEGL
jgi:hypothetical protein